MARTSRTTTSQEEPPARTWGGRRPGAGRPPNGDKPGAPHTPRPDHAARHPAHITWTVAEGVPSLGGKRAFHALTEALTAGRERFGARVVHFSVKGNQLHLIVEATDQVALSRSLQGLAVRIARGVNRALDRSGKLFADRFLLRTLETPEDVKSALSLLEADESPVVPARTRLLRSRIPRSRTPPPLRLPPSD